MKNVRYDASYRAESLRVWKTKNFNLNFCSRERYKAAVRILMNSDKYELVTNGRYLSGPAYGYVSFRRKRDCQ